MEKVKELYFDCKTGISGDMVLAALFDLGACPNMVKDGLGLLQLPQFEIEVKNEIRYETQGCNVFFNYMGETNQHNTHSHSHRSFREIEKIINNSSLSAKVKEKAVSIYHTIGVAEATVHETDIDNVHFHEVGRDFAILNIVGVALCIEDLNIEKIYCSDIHDGSGQIECSHGVIPVPVPAVKAMMVNTNLNFVQGDFNTEMVTPSGLGILKGLGATHSEKPTYGIEKIGYGFGKKNVGKLSVLSGYLLDKNIK